MYRQHLVDQSRTGSVGNARVVHELGAAAVSARRLRREVDLKVAAAAVKWLAGVVGVRRRRAGGFRRVT